MKIGHPLQSKDVPYKVKTGDVRMVIFDPWPNGSDPCLASSSGKLKGAWSSEGDTNTTLKQDKHGHHIRTEGWLPRGFVRKLCASF